MEVLITDVDIGTRYKEKIYDYWIIGRIKSGLDIKIFDAKPFNISDQIHNTILCLIVATFVKIIKSEEKSKGTNFYGVLHKSYNIPKVWYNSNIWDTKLYNLKSNWTVIKHIDGIFLTTLNDEEINNIKDGDSIQFQVGRFDLLAWCPIE